jgi:hypothetical protein
LDEGGRLPVLVVGRRRRKRRRRRKDGKEIRAKGGE